MEFDEIYWRDGRGPKNKRLGGDPDQDPDPEFLDLDRYFFITKYFDKIRIILFAF